jgi:RimJ/RimL family protein N-acetyltransferase
MAFFRTVSSHETLPAIAGAGVTLRVPQGDDYAEWAALRETSRAFLVPWEPSWPADDLTRGAFRRRLKRYAEDLRNDLAYAFLIFRSEDNALVGGLTLANIRDARFGPVLLRDATAASPGGGLHSGQYRLGPPAGEDRFPTRGLCAQLSVHQWGMAGSSALCAAQGRRRLNPAAFGLPRLACYKIGLL